jgi:hypothetical protein
VNNIKNLASKLCEIYFCLSVTNFFFALLSSVYQERINEALGDVMLIVLEYGGFISIEK